jgi:demethylmenaquinone methyltransferase/2-methoxy-6-polyprenyl-1,4-benzoquinol methylase
MFAGIAPRYDLANHLLSMRIDHSWRRFVARHLLDRPGKVLDIASGTGDLAVELSRRGKHRVISADFTYEMLLAGQSKVRRLAPGTPQLAGDALQLPLKDHSVDAVSVGFGIRNFADPAAGLREMRRVVRPGGSIGVLEFSQPRGLFGALYRIYAFRILPALGGLVTGHRDPYEYLPASVREFPEGEAFLELMRHSGLVEVEAHRLTGGIVTFYKGRCR